MILVQFFYLITNIFIFSCGKVSEKYRNETSRFIPGWLLSWLMKPQNVVGRATFSLPPYGSYCLGISLQPKQPWKLEGIFSSLSWRGSKWLKMFFCVLFRILIKISFRWIAVSSSLLLRYGNDNFEKLFGKRTWIVKCFFVFELWYFE